MFMWQGSARSKKLKRRLDHHAKSCLFIPNTDRFNEFRHIKTWIFLGRLKILCRNFFSVCWQRLGSLMHQLRLSQHELCVLRLMCATGGAEAKSKINSVVVWFTSYKLYKGFVKEPLQDPCSCLQHKSVHVSISKCEKCCTKCANIAC